MDGTPITMATWAAEMAVTCAAGGLAVYPGGVVSSISYVDYVAGLSTDIQSHTLGDASH